MWCKISKYGDPAATVHTYIEADLAVCKYTILKGENVLQIAVALPATHSLELLATELVGLDVQVELYMGELMIKSFKGNVSKYIISSQQEVASGRPCEYIFIHRI